VTLFKCIIELPKHAIKKNGKSIFQNKSTGQRFIASNSKSQHLMSVLNAQLLKEKLKQRIDTIECDVNVKFIFGIPSSVYFTKKQTRSSRVPDLSNMVEAPQDAMQKVGIITNDSNIYSLNGSCRVPIEGAVYKLFIEITKIEEKDRIISL
jgi:Holliday junction resolvase RusA-like endonuclease